MTPTRCSVFLLLGMAICCLSVDLSSEAVEPRATKAVSPASEKIDFHRDIEPILAKSCIECHGPKEPEGGLRLRSREDLLTLNDSGKPAVVLGKSNQSELIRRILSADEDERMPAEGKRLTAKQISLLSRWIDQGAVWPDNENVQPKHWAYVRPVRPTIPSVQNGAWPKNPIDYFILARLDSEGMEPSPPADRARLIRRVFLDLIGLPPSVDEVEAFANDTRPDAYERVVQRLLKSPRYGEHWARHWLDLARYADSNGFQADQLRDSWAYRDWVIEAMNADMPFDQFTIEQIAGDLLPNPTLAQKIATGFHRTPTCNVEAGVDPEENRTNQVIDRVNTTATVWLGTTLQCAQCHNHKYDPFTMKDYYQLFSFFNNTPLEVANGGSGVSFDFYGPKIQLPLFPEQKVRRQELRLQCDQMEEALEERITEVSKQMPVWEHSFEDVSTNPLETHALEIDFFESSGGASHETLQDGSVLISGKLPGKDVYTITAHTYLTEITGFELELLTDPSLPENGPGRGDKPNVILNEFSVTAIPRGGKKEQAVPVTFRSANADYSQKNWDVGGAIDGIRKTGWALGGQFGKPHQAHFYTSQAIGSEGGTTLRFELVQHFGRGRTIGRFRLAALTGQESASIPQEILKVLAKPSKKRSRKQKKQLLDHFLSLDPSVQKMRGEVAKLQERLEAIEPPSTLVMVEMQEPRTTNIFMRGVFLDKGPEVTAEVPAILHPMPEGTPPNRLGLAKWLVDPNDPLVGRVTVNRWWAEIFAKGLVRTGEDFGSQGELPTHPKLLDWLAVEFIESGWSMKHVHELIVTSAMYQQSSRISPELLEKDPENLLFGRGSRFRLSAETIRDNGLAISGLLSTKTFGPPIYPPQPPGLWHQTGRNEPKFVADTDEDRFRRGVYVIWRRAAPYPSFTNFDAPDRTACVVQRSRTNTPLQALTSMNDEVYVEMAKALAARILTDRPEIDDRQRIVYAFRLCLTREPEPAEIEYLQAVYRHELDRFEGDPKTAKALIGEFELPEIKKTPEDLSQWAAWFFVSNILLNLDETITRG